MIKKNKFEGMNIKDSSYYDLDNLIDINHLIPENIKIDKISNLHIFNYYIRHKTSNRVKQLFIIFRKMAISKTMMLIKRKRGIF